jgi:hypothetical protein
VDAEGNAYVTGTTDATDFPVTIGALDTGCGTDGFCNNDSFGGISDVFVTKLNPTGSALVYSTFLGGSDADYGNSIAVDVSGNVYITGTTFSKDFPTVNPLQPAKGGDICDGIPCSDAFVAKLNPTGSALIYSTYLGGGPNMNGFGGFDQGLSIAVDTLGNTYVTGSTNSDSFPIVNSLQSFKGSGTCGGIPCSDAFVAKLNPTGSSLVYSIYLGGNGDDFGFGIAMDTSGNAYITSKTVSANFPHTAGAFNTSCGTDGLCHSSNNFTDVTSDVFITNIAPGLSVPLTDAVDYNGDGKADFTVYRPSTGQWFVFGAADSTSFGSVNDIPTPGDYNGDGVPDFAFFRPSTGQWHILLSNTETVQNLGQIGDIPAPKDYDGDGKTDCAVFRPTTGEWLVLLSGGNLISLIWGVAGDVPVPADYDGDGRTDMAVFRPIQGAWYILNSRNGVPLIRILGKNGDDPVPGDYNGDGRASPTVWEPDTGTWMDLVKNGRLIKKIFGIQGDLLVPADFDGDGKTDLGIFHASTGQWFILTSSSGFKSSLIMPWGLPGDVPLVASGGVGCGSAGV